MNVNQHTCTHKLLHSYIDVLVTIVTTYQFISVIPLRLASPVIEPSVLFISSCGLGVPSNTIVIIIIIYHHTKHHKYIFTRSIIIKMFVKFAKTHFIHINQFPQITNSKRTFVL